MKTIASLVALGAAVGAYASRDPLASLEHLSTSVEALVLDRMPSLEAVASGRMQPSRARALRAAVQDDPKGYCEKNPTAGCCKLIAPIIDECESYFSGGLDPSKLCPSQCAADIQQLAKALPGSGQRDGVCASAIQGVSLVNLGCAKATDGGYCFDEVTNVGLLLNQTHPSPMKVEVAVSSLCETSGGADGTCFQQLQDGQTQVYSLMDELLSGNPWGETDDQYPWDDDVPNRPDDDAAPFNPLWTAQPTVRGLDLFCNRVEVAPLSPKNPFCLVHLIDNTTIFGSDDDQPTPQGLIGQLSDPCARSFFASVTDTDPIAISVGTYGNGRRQSDNSQCGIATGFGWASRNLTAFCASEEGGSSTVFNVVGNSPNPTCAPQCASLVEAQLAALGCCSQELFFESWYVGADPPVMPSRYRPPMDAWISRISQVCSIDLSKFYPTCGSGEPLTIANVNAVFSNSKAGYLSLNQTESDAFQFRLCVQTERNTGAPAGSCRATMPPRQNPEDPQSMIVPLAIQFENQGQAAAAASLLANSPPSARAACKYLERRAPKAVYDPTQPVLASFEDVKLSK